MSVRERIKSIIQIFRAKRGLPKYSSERELSDVVASKSAFNIAKARMFNVNSWGNIPGPDNATFILFDAKGLPYILPENPDKELKPRKGDFIKIVLAGNIAESWVEVSDVREKESEASFIIKSSNKPPHTVGKKKATKYFSNRTTINAFKVKRKGNKIIAIQIGKNESANIRNPKRENRNSPNTMIPEPGWALIQEMQRKNLTDYIVGNL